MPGPDDLAALKAERAAADREYNDALTRLDQAIQQLPRNFPHPPPGPDEQQITPLNTLWKIGLPAVSGRVVSSLRRLSPTRRVVGPLFEQPLTGGVPLAENAPAEEAEKPAQGTLGEAFGGAGTEDRNHGSH